jgi:moderate conductance mechanosensitive channel
MPLDLFSIDIPKEAAAKVFFAVLTLLIAILSNVLLYSLFNISKNLQDKRAKTYAVVVKNGISFVVFAIAFYVILAILGVDVTPLLASAGVIGIIIGMGTRSVVEDLIAGFFLVAQDSLSIGDYIKVDETEGRVDSVGLRTLQVKSEDGAMWIIPNGTVRKIVNYSRRRSNVIIYLPVSGVGPVDKFMKVIQRAIDDLLADKDLKEVVFTTSRIDGIEDIRPGNQLVIRVTIVTTSERRLEVARKFRYLLKSEFDDNKLNFA